MSKTGGGCVVGMIFFSVAFPSVGLLLASITGISWLGDSIGEHRGMVATYVVIGFIGGYIIGGIALLISLCACFVSPKDGLAGLFGTAVYLVFVSIILAFPSSFIAQSACTKDNNPQAVWVMRVIPVLGLTELALADDTNHLACVDHKLVGG